MSGFDVSKNNKLSLLAKEIFDYVIIHIFKSKFDEYDNWINIIPGEEEKYLHAMSVDIANQVIAHIASRPGQGIASTVTEVSIQSIRRVVIKVYNILVRQLRVSKHTEIPSWPLRLLSMDFTRYISIVNNKNRIIEDYIGSTADMLTRYEGKVDIHSITDIRIYIFLKILTGDCINIKQLTPNRHMGSDEVKRLNNAIEHVMYTGFRKVFKKKIEFVNTYTDGVWGMDKKEIYIVDHDIKCTAFGDYYSKPCDTNSAVNGKRGYFVTEYLYSDSLIPNGYWDYTLEPGNYSDWKCSPIDFIDLFA